MKLRGNTFAKVLGMIELLKYIKIHLEADFNTGKLYWRYPKRGRDRTKPAGGRTSAGYISIGIAGKRYFAHKIVYFLYHDIWPDNIDHINRVKDDNRIINLRETNHSLNWLNRRSNSNSRLKIKGVYFTRSGYRVIVAGKHIGYFKDFDKAVEIANINYQRLQGELYD